MMKAFLSGSFCTFQQSIFSIAHCMDNYVPGILKFAEASDIAGLIAPRPLFVENGEQDSIFPVDGVRLAFEKTRSIYQILGKEEDLALEVFPGKHEFWGKKGPVDGVASDPRYLDVSVAPGRRKRLAVDRANHAFAYVFAGSGTFRDASAPQGILTEQVDGGTTRTLPAESENRSLILFDRGDEVVVQAGDQGIRFLLVSGKPIEEPVAWYGPIVMNTKQELQQALSDLRNGTFISR